MNMLRTTLLCLACTLPAVCFAQWQWIDKDGRKVFSDQSPPADIPAKNILRQPGTKPVAAPQGEEPTAAPGQAAKTAANAPKLSGKDSQLEEKKKQAEAAEARKQQAEEEERSKLRAENCARAKRSKAGFDSGIRIARINDKGEREILDDAARSAESKRADAVIASDCKPAGG